MKVVSIISNSDLTPEQKSAVEVLDKNLLVTAAAGSGKTKVLVDRIKHIVLSGLCDVNQILVVTFTNAAAQEMRSRIHAALSDALQDTAGEDAKRLERQILLLSSASITTMHSFCQSLLKRNFSKIDLDPKFRVADEHELNLIKQDVIEELFESKYSSGDENFRRFTDDFGGTEKGDDALHKLILKLFNFSQSNENPKEWLQSLPKHFDIPKEAVLADTIWYEPALKQIKFIINSTLSFCQFTLSLAMSNGIYDNDIMDDFILLTKISDIAKTEDWDKIREAIVGCEFKRLSAIKKKTNYFDHQKREEAKTLIQNCRDSYKKAIKNLAAKYFFASENQMTDDLRELKTSVETLAKVTIDFVDAYAAAKREKNIIDFNDMEHFALQILSDPASAAVLRQKYRFVMVDEYQDTNRVQEAILNAIVRDDNLFVVGDVKQSIYKFRLADPSLFLEKFNNYPNQKDYAENNEKVQKFSNCLRIDLSKNFRSRPQVIDAVNFVFENLMVTDGKGKDANAVMEITYDEDARLYPGLEYPPCDVGTALDTKTEFYLINDKLEIDEESSSDSDFESPEALDRAARETQIIANRIQKFFADNTQVYDKGLKKYRPLRYSDIVILRRSKQNPKSIMDVLKKNKIPAYSVGDETYFKKLEIQIIIALLTVLDNTRQDIPMAAVMLSPIGDFTAEDLAMFKIAAKNDDLFTVLMTAAASNAEMNPLNLPQELITKSNSFLQRLNDWRSLSRIVSVPELISTIYRETGYYDYVGGLPEGVSRQANLRMLIDRAAAFEASSFRGISRFLKFIKKIKELKTDLAVARNLGENENVVRLITIHKSKGLEFPIVFVSELSKNFNNTDDKTDLLLRHRTLGLGPYKTLKNEPLRCPTFARHVISQVNNLENKAEELRILYVAMTRAREKLILVGTRNKSEKKYSIFDSYAQADKIPIGAVVSANSFLDCLLIVKSKAAEFGRLFDFSEIPAYKVKFAEETVESVKEIKPDISAFIQVSTTVMQENIPSKMSVTELKQRVEEGQELTENLITAYDDIAYKRPDFEQSKKLTGAEYGTLMHKVMQRLDLHGDLTSDGIARQIETMIAEDIFNEEQAKVIHRDKIAKFFAGDIGQRLRTSNEVYRELPFSRLIEAKLFFPNVNDKIFIQGIIDVLFKDGDKFILLDYKTDRIETDNPTEHFRDKYQLQIKLYTEAVEAIIKRSIAERYLYMLNGDLLISV